MQSRTREGRIRSEAEDAMAHPRIPPAAASILSNAAVHEWSRRPATHANPTNKDKFCRIV